MNGRFAIGLVVAATGAMLLAGSASAVGTVVTCGSQIKKSGMYRLKDDCTGRGINIFASDVALDLRGHTMTADKSGMNIGIYAADVGNVEIRGPGVIKKFDYGIALGEVGGIKVGNVTIKKSTLDGVNVQLAEAVSFDGTISENNGGVGFYEAVTGGNSFHNVRATGNPQDGIEVVDSFETQITKSTTSNNGDDGIFVVDGSEDNFIANNTALGNGNFDLYDGNTNCDSNIWTGNTFGTNFPTSCVS
jgi:parallel beta-helix repeat protein